MDTAVEAEWRKQAAGAGSAPQHITGNHATHYRRTATEMNRVQLAVLCFRALCVTHEQLRAACQLGSES